MEEQQGRMMLYPQQNYGMGGMVGGEESLATSPASAQGDESQQQRQHADINTILDQVRSFSALSYVRTKHCSMFVAITRNLVDPRSWQ